MIDFCSTQMSFYLVISFPQPHRLLDRFHSADDDDEDGVSRAVKKIFDPNIWRDAWNAEEDEDGDEHDVLGLGLGRAFWEQSSKEAKSFEEAERARLAKAKRMKRIRRLSALVIACAVLGLLAYVVSISRQTRK